MNAQASFKARGLQYPELEHLLSANANNVLNFDAAVVRQDAHDTRIIVHSRFPELVQRFLDHKRARGSKYEKALYTGTWTWQQQVARLIEKRPLMFCGSNDATLDRDGVYVRSARTEWDRVGTANEHKNSALSLQEYLSYDEMMLGSLMGVSGPSHFINDGNRYNGGAPGAAGTFEPRGVIMGLVGARFERADRMDSVHVLRAASNPRQHPELSALFQQFLGGARDPQAAFDTGMYKARMRVTADILLLEADARAGDAGRAAYVYVVGLGLGVWQYDSKQTSLYLEAFAESLAALGPSLGNIGTLDFAWVAAQGAVRRLVEDAASRLGIRTKFTRRSPAAPLEGAEAGQLLVLSYAWDSNSFPGNEYWQGSLSASGDPAAACMSTIAQLHNPLYNPGFLQRIQVLDPNPGS